MSKFGEHQTGKDKEDIFDAFIRIAERDGYDNAMHALFQVMEFITDSDYYPKKFREPHE